MPNRRTYNPKNHRPRPAYHPRARGIVAFFAVILLALLALVCMAFFNSTSMSLAQTTNIKAVNDANIAAEGGFTFMLYQVRRCNAVGSVFVDDLFGMVRTGITTNLNGTGNLGGHPVIVNGTGKLITIPDIDLGGGKSFSATLELVTVIKPNDTMRMIVVGRARHGDADVTRKMSVDYKLQGGVDGPLALKYGISSAGPITLNNNSELVGARCADEASIYSAWTGKTPPAVTLLNGTKVPGGVFTPEGATVVINPNNIIHETISEETVNSLSLPRIDPAPYKNPAYTGVTLTEFNSTSSAGLSEYSNIIIKANTNPTFSKNGVTFKGIIYVEAPNNVTIGNKCTFQGILVGGDLPPGVTGTCRVYFDNTTTVLPPETLPDTAEFHKIRDLPNVSILAPDFLVEFKNNLSSVDFTGLVAVKELKTGNNTNLSLKGGIMVYGSQGFTVGNNMVLSLSLTSVVPLGFDGYVPKASYALLPDFGTFYME